MSESPPEQTTACQALQKILDWCNAYPIEVFPDPDLGAIRELIGENAMSCLHASWARHLLQGIARHARSGLGVQNVESDAAERLRFALRQLLDQVIAGGFLTATHYNWPKAIAEAQQALEDT